MYYGAMNFPVKPVLEEIELFSQLGFDYLELAMDPPMAHHSILAENRAFITRTLGKNGLGLVCHLPTFVSTADLTRGLRQASVSEMRHSLMVAADLGAEKVVLHPSMVVGMGPFVLDQVKEYYTDFMHKIVTIAEQRDITICLENMMPANLLGVEPHDFEEFFSLFPGLKLTLDTGHANINSHGGNRLQALIAQFGHRIGHLHISDNRGQRDEHLPVGRGTVNFRQLLQAIRATGYDDTLTLEIFDTDRRLLVESRERIKSLLARC